MADADAPGTARLRAALPWILVAGLLAVALYLLAERNAHRYLIDVEDGKLVVRRGLFFPFGTGPYQPSISEDAAAYAPIPIPRGEQARAESFSEKDRLDRALYGYLVSWSRDKVRAGGAEDLESAFALISRAGQLTGLSAVQHEELGDLRGEVSFHEARRRLERAVEELRRAHEHLRNAARSSRRYGGAGEEILDPTERARRAAEDAARAAASALAQERLGDRLGDRLGARPPASPAIDGGEAAPQPEPARLQEAPPDGGTGFHPP